MPLRWSARVGGIQPRHRRRGLAWSVCPAGLRKRRAPLPKALWPRHRRPSATVIGPTVPPGAAPTRTPHSGRAGPGKTCWRSVGASEVDVGRFRATWSSWPALLSRRGPRWGGFRRLCPYSIDGFRLTPTDASGDPLPIALRQPPRLSPPLVGSPLARRHGLWLVPLAWQVKSSGAHALSLVTALYGVVCSRSCSSEGSADRCRALVSLAADSSAPPSSAPSTLSLSAT